MSADAWFRLVFASLALFWDLTGDVCAQREPDAVEYAATHGDVFPYSLSYRQQAENETRFEQVSFLSLRLVLFQPGSPECTWFDAEPTGWLTAEDDLLYDLMSLQR